MKRRVFDDADRPSLPQRDSRLCVAHGCPLPGVHSHSLTGSSDWFCCVHDGLQASAWQHATKLVNDNEGAFRIAYRLMKLGTGEAIPAELASTLSRHGRDDLYPREAKTAYQAGLVIRGKLVTECKQGGERWKPQIVPKSEPRSVADYV